MELGFTTFLVLETPIIGWYFSEYELQLHLVKRYMEVVKSFHSFPKSICYRKFYESTEVKQASVAITEQPSPLQSPAVMLHGVSVHGK